MMKAVRNALAVTTLVASGSVLAADGGWQLTVSPSLDFAFKQSSFVFSGAASGTFDTKPSYTSFVPAIAVGYGPIYGVLSRDTQLGLWQTTSSTALDYTATGFSRDETSFTLGYRVWRTVNIFAGYVNGRSSLTQTTYSAAVPDPFTFDFNESGMYLGASYGHQFGNKGTLSVSAAYGNMDGKMVAYGVGAFAPSFMSTAPGYSVSLGWVGPLTGSMVYRAGLKYTKYNFDIEQVNLGPIIIPLTNPIYIDEKIVGFSIGIANYF